MDPKYKLLAERVPNHGYQDCLRHILVNGEFTRNPFQPTGTYTSLTTPNMIFYLENGFPVLTERKIGFWKKPIAELLAFINGVHDARVLSSVWGVNWWEEKWATPEKCADFNLPPYEMGPGSYGPGFASHPHFEWVSDDGPDGGLWVPRPFNQFYHLVRQIRDYPALRTHKVSPWIPQYCLQHKGLKRKVVVAPCHGDVQITILGNKLTLRMDQRSADFPIGVPANIIQYAALTVMIAHVTGYEPYMYIHSAHDAQIYEDQVDWVKMVLDREPRAFPTLHLTEEGLRVTELLDFRPHHFELREYDPHPAIAGIPVTV